MYGRRYNDGLHQAIEAKEGVKIADESKTLATIKTDVELPFSLDDLTFEFPFSKKARALFVSLELKNLLNDLRRKKVPGNLYSK